jgi:glucosylceramidase
MNYARLLSKVKITLGLAFPLFFFSCNPPEAKPAIDLEIYTSSAAGAKMAKGEVYDSITDHGIEIFPEQSFQSIQGFGGAFTESSSHLLQSMSAEKRQEILEAYFASDGAAYSLCRSHINSCDFSLKPYAYANVPGHSLL